MNYILLGPRTLSSAMTVSIMTFSKKSST